MLYRKAAKGNTRFRELALIYFPPTIIATPNTPNAIPEYKLIFTFPPSAENQATSTSTAIRKKNSPIINLRLV